MDAKRLCGSLMAMRLASPFFILFLGEPQPLRRPVLWWCWVLSRTRSGLQARSLKAGPGQPRVLLASPRALGFCPSSG